MGKRERNFGKGRRGEEEIKRRGIRFTAREISDQILQSQ